MLAGAWAEHVGSFFGYTPPAVITGTWAGHFELLFVRAQCPPSPSVTAPHPPSIASRVRLPG